MGFLHLRDSRTKVRNRVENFDFKENVEALKGKAMEITGLKVEEQQMVYCGRTLEDHLTVLSYGLTDGVTIYIFPKKKLKNNLLDNGAENVKPFQLTELLDRAMKNPIYQASVKRILQDADAIEQLIAATPALKKDPVALALLRDPELLLQVAETANVEKIVKDHPALAQAAGHIIAAVTEDNSSRHLPDFNNDDSAEMQDLEGMDPGLMARAEMIAAQEESIQQRQAAQPHQISAAQLAMALSQAGVSGASASTPPRQQQRPQQPAQSSQTAITADFFSQAIASALATASQQPGTQANVEQPLHQAALQQMRDVGITDDNLSLRALQQTGGDVQAALSLIFEGELN